MKVWKPVGAVAVYSRTRVVALIAACVLAIGGLGFLGGLVVGEGDESSAATDPPRPASATQADTPEPTTASVPAADKPDKAEDGDSAAPARRAYRRGYRNGLRAATNGLDVGSAYFVRVARGGANGLRIGRREQIEEGRTYWLCAGGQRLCIRNGGS